MKTPDITTANIIPARIQSLMAVVGIVTAIVCGLILMQEASDKLQHAAREFSLKAPALSVESRVAKAADFSVLTIARVIREY